MATDSFVLPERPYRLANVNVPPTMLDSAIMPDERGLLLASVDIEVDAEGNVRRVVSAVNKRQKTDTLATIDMLGRQVWAGLVDVHAHLDKAYTWSRAPNPEGTLSGARSAAKKDRSHPWSAEDVSRRMEFAIRCALAHGTAGLRTHIDSQSGRALPSWPVFQMLQKRWLSQIELQGVATLGVSKLAGDYGDRVCEIAKRHNAKALGPVIYRSEELEVEILRSFALAEKYGLDLDFHVDETDDPAAEGLREIAKLALARRFKGRIVCGHACSLSVQDSVRAQNTIAIVRDAGIGVVCLPSSNLFLQDRSQATPRWRGVTLVRELAAAGVSVAVAGDNASDAFNPFADFDLVDAFRDAVRLAHLDQPSIESWLGAISSTPAIMAGMTRASGKISEGSPANFMIFQGRTVREVLARYGRDRIVVHKGRVSKIELPSFTELDGAS